MLGMLTMYIAGRQLPVLDMQCTPWVIIFLPLIVFTATISLSVFLRVDLVRRALYTMPNSPAINALVNCVNVLYVLVLEINLKLPSADTYKQERDRDVLCFTKEFSLYILV